MLASDVPRSYRETVMTKFSFGWRPTRPFVKTDLANPPKYVPTPVTVTPVAKESSTMSFISVLEAVGKDAEKALTEVVKYAVPVASLASLLFPAAAAGSAVAVTAVTLIQNAVLEVEAKTSLLPAGLTVAQKAADVLQMVGPAVTAILAQEKITAGSAEVANLIAAVSAILAVAPSSVSA